MRGLHSGGGRRLSHAVSLLLTLAATTAVLTACGSEARADPEVGELLAEPERYAGETVTFEAAVSNPIDHRVWEMADGRLFVVYDRGLSSGLAVGERLRVTGSVQDFDKETIEGDLGVNIEDHFFDEPFLRDDTAFVAESVERLGEG